MQDPTDANPQASRREPWNKGKLIGAKPPLRPKHVWSIRTKLQIAGRTRDLAMFNLAIDSKLRGCDVVHRSHFEEAQLAPETGGSKCVKTGAVRSWRQHCAEFITSHSAPTT